MFIAVIVGDGRHGGSVGMERQSRQRAAFAQIASDEFGGEMLRVRGAAAISEEEGLAAVAIGGDERAGRDGHGGQARLQQTAVNLDAALDVLSKNVVRHPRLPFRQDTLR